MSEPVPVVPPRRPSLAGGFIRHVPDFIALAVSAVWIAAFVRAIIMPSYTVPPEIHAGFGLTLAAYTTLTTLLSRKNDQ